MEEEELLVGQQSLRGHKMIKEAVLNNSTFAKRSLHQTLCLQKRCQGLTTVVCPSYPSLFDADHTDKI
jgi:hypothetical protein